MGRDRVSIARACFAVVHLDNRGQVVSEILGCLPARMPQSALSAEPAKFFTFWAFSRDCTVLETVMRCSIGFEALGSDAFHAFS